MTAIVRRAMSLDPEERFGSAAALGYALQTVERDMHRPVTEMKLSVVAPTGGPPSALSIPTPALLDSERTRTRRRGFSEGEQASSNEAWSGNSTTNRRGVVDSESKRPAWVIPVLVVVGVLATAALVVAMLTGGGHSVRLGAGEGPSVEATTEQWSDPGGDPGGALPDSVGEVTATPNGSEILWGWQVPSQSQYSSDQLVFKYVLTRPGEDVVAETIRRNSLTTTAVSGENCLAVSVVVESSGRESSPVTQCVTVP